MAGYSVVDVANQSLDAMSWPLVLGDIQDGSHEAQVLLRAYSLCRKQLLRAANWSFARKTAPMTLLADASGNTKNVGTRVPNTWFIYEYALPTDCLRPRFVPAPAGPAPHGYPYAGPGRPGNADSNPRIQ